MKSLLAGAQRLVVKVGSSLLTNEGRGLDRPAIARWAEQIAQALQQTGGKKGAAARLLGIDRATFYRKERHMRQEQGLERTTQDSNAEEP